jgi:hypothetical protein
MRHLCLAGAAAAIAVAAHPMHTSVALEPAAHPMHTSVTELVHDPASRTVSILVRVFADDWAAAGGRPDAMALPRLQRDLKLCDAAGHPLPLRWEGAAHVADALVLRLRTDVPGGLSGLKISQVLLTDHFPDQINIVRATYAGRTESLLFTRSDQAKALP